MAQPIAIVGAAKLMTGTGVISTGPCQLLGFYVNSTSSGTLVIDDNGTAISGTITPAIGWHNFPASIGTAANATIANTLNVTFFFASGN